MTNIQVNNKQAEEQAKKNKADVTLAKQEQRRKEKRDRDDKEKWKTESRDRVRGQNMQYAGQVVGTVGKMLNGPVWYNKVKSVFDEATKLQFNNPLGRADNSGIALGLTTRSAVPGMAIIDWMPAVSYQASARAPQNISLRKIYRYVRKKAPRSTTYEMADLGLYIMCADSLVIGIGFAAKMLGLLNFVQPSDLYTVQAYIEAHGFDYYDMVNNILDYTGRLNKIIVNAGAYRIPRVWDYINRHWFLSHGIFKDTEQLKSQLYSFRPRFLHRFGIQDENMPLPGAGYLDPILIPYGSGFTFGDYLDIVNENLEAMLEQEDIGNISGDIQTAFEDDLVNLVPVDTSITMMPEYSAEVLSQIKNITLCGSPTTTDTDSLESYKWRYGIFQKDQNFFMGNLSRGINGVYGPIVKVNLPGYDATNMPNVVWPPHFNEWDKLLDLYKTTPTADDIMVATRGMAVLGAPFKSGNSYYRTVLNYSSEIFFEMHVYYYGSNEVDTLSEVTFSQDYFLIGNTNANDGSITLSESNSIKLGQMSRILSAFDWAPLITIWGIKSTGSTFQPQLLSADFELQTYAIVPKDILANLELAAMMSLFGLEGQTEQLAEVHTGIKT